MDARILIETLQSRGLSISLARDKVRVEALHEPDEDTKTLLLELRTHKEEIKSILAATTNLTLDHIADTFFIDDERHKWLYLVIKRPETLPQGPITVKPGLRIMDVARFTEATIQDLITYVSARNGGSSHWVDTVLDEKLDYLELCGITAEIRAIQ